MSNVALIILFNHNYEANLDRLKEIYTGRFDDIWFIMPFYSGTRKDIITVYENSYYFQGYIAKALEQIRNDRFEHYLIIGDDLILNPGINQDNYKEYFKVDSDTAFVPSPFLLNDTTVTKPNRPMAPFWNWSLNALNFDIKQPGIEASKFLPSYDEAVTLLKRHGYNFTPNIPLKFYSYNKLASGDMSKAALGLKRDYLKFSSRILSNIVAKSTIPYPMIGSYSDCVVLPHSHINSIIKYCGITAALNLFVEIGLPTSIALSVPKISTEDSMPQKGKTFWLPIEVAEFENSYNNSFEKFENEFPEDALYVHPVKLSRWK